MISVNQSPAIGAQVHRVHLLEKKVIEREQSYCKPRHRFPPSTFFAEASVQSADGEMNFISSEFKAILIHVSTK